MHPPFGASGSSPQTVDLGIGRQRVALHSHISYIWTDVQDFEAAIGFLEQGLRGGDRCFIRGDDACTLRVLRSRGFAVDELIANGRITILPPSTSADGLLTTLGDALRKAVADGVTLSRFFGVPGWDMEGWPDFTDLLRYESRLTTLARDFPCVMLCTYDKRALTADALWYGGVCAHPRTIGEGIAAENRHFVPPSEFLPMLDTIGTLLENEHRADATLRRSYNFFRNAFAHAAIGMAITDLSGRYIEVNQAYCAMTGYGANELLGMCVLDITHPEDITATTRTFEQLLSGTVPSSVIEKRYLRKSGEVIWVRSSASVLRDDEGKPAYMIAFVEDVTERKLAEDALRQLSGRLLRAQEEERRRIALELHDSTSQRLAALAMNLSVVHESAASLGARAGRALGESIELSEECLHEIRTLSYLLYPPELESLGLFDAVRQYVSGFARRSGLSVDLDMRDEGDRLDREVETALFRVLQESLTNIHRHSNSRSARVRIVRGPGAIVLQVQDEGGGMGGAQTAEEQRTTATPGVGITGMRERLRQLGGSLTIESDSAGTTVTATLPLT